MSLVHDVRYGIEFLGQWLMILYLNEKSMIRYFYWVLEGKVRVTGY